ncbi:MAG: hypothetical protein DMG07_05940 [Acidobacteria bacterium]|nr:MAG: hypothetical protein DMG07_05940 [Acidobacteriota bacterium]
MALILLSATTAGYYDLRWRRIPNWLVIATVGFSIVWHVATGGLAGLGKSLAGLLVGTAVFLPLFLIRGMGAGDVKLCGALGAAVRYPQVFTLLIISVAITGLMALCWILWEWSVKETLANIVDILDRFLHGRFSPHPVLNTGNKSAAAVPFGVSVAIATWVFVLIGAQ